MCEKRNTLKKCSADNKPQDSCSPTNAVNTVNAVDMTVETVEPNESEPNDSELIASNPIVLELSVSRSSASTAENEDSTLNFDTEH